MKLRYAKILTVLSSIALGVLIPASFAAGQNISVRNNLIYDASGTPNLGVELPLSGHWSIGGNIGLKPWPRFFFWDTDVKENTSKWKHFLVSPELRYYPDSVYNGWFFGSGLVYTHYNVGNVRFPFGMYKEVRDKRVQGDFYGLGLFAGRSWWLNDRWRIEAEAGVAVGAAAYEIYECSHCGARLGNNTKLAFVPKLGLNIAYNLQARHTDEPQAPVPPQRPVHPNRPELQTPPSLFEARIPFAKAPETTGSLIAKETPWVLPQYKYVHPAKMKRSGRDSLLYVNFPLNKSMLLRDFPKDRQLLRKQKSNGVILDSIVSVASRLMQDTLCDMSIIQIIGLASVEGPYSNNIKLAQSRADALKSYIKEKLNLDESCFESFGKGEGWDWFRAQMEELAQNGGYGLSKRDIAKILRIIDEEPDPDRREKLLKADKAMYRVLRDSILADQRNSGFVRIYFYDKPDTASLRVNRIISLIQGGRLPELLSEARNEQELLEEISRNAEALNAYAVSEFMQAAKNNDEEKMAAALKLLCKAAETGLDAAVYNFECAAKYLDSYKAYLNKEKEQEDGYQQELILYNRLMENYESARSAFDIEYKEYVRKLGRYRKINKNK